MLGDWPLQFATISYRGLSSKRLCDPSDLMALQTESVGSPGLLQDWTALYYTVSGSFDP